MWGDSLVLNQYITKPKNKNVGGHGIYYIPTGWKSGGTSPPCPQPNCAHAGQSITLLHLESPSDKCTRLHTVAASNDRDHLLCSFYYCLFTPHIYGCCCWRTSCLWWIAHSTQRQPRGCKGCSKVGQDLWKWPRVKETSEMQSAFTKT